MTLKSNAAPKDNPDAIEILVEEHQLIAAVLGALKGFVVNLPRTDSEIEEDRNPQAEKKKLADFVDFFKGFADDHHHAKEENILFRVMVENGFSKEMGPVAVMLFEHDEGRKYLGQLKEASQKKDSWTSDEYKRIARAALSFVDLLAAHIQKEDRILYPMARSNLPREVMDRVDREVQAFEKTAYESGGAKRMRNAAALLLREAQDI